MYRIQLFFLIALLSGCAQVEFRHPQPSFAVAEKKFPGFLVGNYLDENLDTLKISNSCFSYREGGMLSIEGGLSDSILLKKGSGFFFLNFKSDSLWYTISFNYSDDGNLAVFTIDAEDTGIIKKIKKIVTVREVYDASGEIDVYIIDPTEEQLNKLFEKNVFKETIVFRKIENK